MSKTPSKKVQQFGDVATAPVEKTRSSGGDDGKIGYISADIPNVEIPTCEGERYEALVRDTLDLAKRADYMIHCLTNMADADYDYELWIEGLLNRNPPRLIHNFHDLNVVADGYIQGLSLLRTVTGNNDNTQVDQRWAEVMLRSQGDDGLIYMPFAGRPWARFGANWLGPADTNGRWDDARTDQVASIHPQCGYMTAMALNYMLTRDDLWKQRMHRLVDRLAQLVVHRDDYCYFPVAGVNPGATISQDMSRFDPDCISEAGGVSAGWTVMGLCHVHRTTGYQPALDLAAKLAVFVKGHSGWFNREGAFTGTAHTHMHARAICGLLEYGLAVGDAEMIEFCCKSYEWARTSGSPIVGFFPSIPGPDTTFDYEALQAAERATEGCSVSDMVSIAIKLSQGGVGDYWDDADRYVRN